MKKTIFLFIIILGFLILIPQVQAFNMPDTAKDIFLPEGTVLEDVLFAAGDSVNINVQAKDDIYAAAGNIVISGVVDGDVIVVGGNVVINADIKGNLRAAGGSVTINGDVGKNISFFGGDITIGEGVEVGKNVIFGGGNVKINGLINKNLYGGGGNVVLNSEILGNLILNSETIIYGNLEYSAGDKAVVSPGAQIQNEEKFSKINAKKGAFKLPVFEAKMLKTFYLIFQFISLLAIIIVGLIITLLFKKFTEKTQKQVNKEILILILKGLVLLIVTPIILFILSITIIGLPLAFILGVLYVIALYLSKIFVAIFIGDRIIKAVKKTKDVNLIGAMILGLVILYIIFAIPIIGWLIKFVVLLWGLGVLYTVLKKKLNLENKL
jgi:hypothetical protein